MMDVHVRNMKSKNGNAVPNQFIIVTDNATYFQSYNTIIAKKTPEGTFLDEAMWDCSITTGKYRNMFLGLDIKETRDYIKQGIFKLADLN